MLTKKIANFPEMMVGALPEMEPYKRLENKRNKKIKFIFFRTRKTIKINENTVTQLAIYEAGLTFLTNRHNNQISANLRGLQYRSYFPPSEP